MRNDQEDLLWAFIAPIVATPHMEAHISAIHIAMVSVYQDRDMPHIIETDTTIVEE